jgi:hypothetical protein
MYAKGLDRVRIEDETLWAAPAGAGIYRLRNIPHGSPYNCDDLVRFSAPDENGFPVAQQVVERGPYRKLAVSIPQESLDDERVRTLVTPLLEEGFERTTPEDFLFNIRRDHYQRVWHALVILEEEGLVSDLRASPDEY